MRSITPRLFAASCASIVTVAAITACARASDSAADTSLPNLGLRSAKVRIESRTDTAWVVMELATTDPQRTMGLMERRSLPDEAGMLFLYPKTQPSDAAFWMYRTRIPLDIAFIDSAGVIRTIVPMEPCTATLAQGCPNYPAGAAFRAALEMNKGYFGRHAFAVGDRVVLDDTASSAAR